MPEIGMVPAAEQIFHDGCGGYSSLIWVAWPVRSLIFLLHHTERWRGWPDRWDGMDKPQCNGAVRGFGHLLSGLKDAGWNLDRAVGQAIGPERPFLADVAVVELEERAVWQLTDSYGRTLRLDPAWMHWSVLRWP